MLDIPSISAVVAAIGVTVGVTLAYLEVRTLVKQRQTDLVMRLYSTFGSNEWLEAFDRVIHTEYKDYSDFVKRGWLDVHKVGIFYEGIGVLLLRKLLDINLVDDLFSGPIKIGWEKMKTVIEDYRKQEDYPQAYEWFEYLYNELQKREQQLQQTQQ